MKKIAVLAVGLLALMGCSEDGDPINDHEVDSGEAEYEFDEVTINGMDCIILHNRTTHGYKVVTFDCDWDSRGE